MLNERTINFFIEHPDLLVSFVCGEQVRTKRMFPKKHDVRVAWKRVKKAARRLSAAYGDALEFEEGLGETLTEAEQEQLKDYSEHLAERRLHVRFELSCALKEEIKYCDTLGFLRAWNYKRGIRSRAERLFVKERLTPWERAWERGSALL